MKRPFVALLMLLAVAAMSAQTLLDNDFSTVAQFEKYTVLDNNEDGQTWQYDDLLLVASCPRDYDADDLLITPGLKLDASKTYKLVFKASVDQAGSEALRVQIEKSVNGFALSSRIVLDTKVTTTSPQEYSAIINVTTSGTYYIGFRCITTNDPFSNRLYLNSVSVEETINQNVPAAVTDLQAVADGEGEQKVTVSFTTPTVSVGGKQLTQLTKVTVKRDNAVVATIDNPGVGATLSYVDEGMADGSHTYTVVPANDYGEGLSAAATVYVGQDVPGPVENLRFVYDYATHKATLTWDAPTKGAHGGHIATEGMTYEVRRFHVKEAAATGLTATAYEDEVDLDFLLQAEEEMRKQYENVGLPVNVNYVVDGQGLMQYYVRAVSPQGQGSETVSNSIIIGEQYELPFADSFADGKLTHYWRTDVRTKNARWSAIADSRFPQDGDGGMLCFNAIEGGETAMCHTGNIAMSTATTPVLSFFYYVDEPWAKPLVVKVAKEGGDFETLTTIDLTNEGLKGRWTRALIPLEGCAGHDFVQIAFEATTSTTIDVIYIDHLTIIDQRAHDLTVAMASVPRNLKVGQTSYLTALVENLGTADVASGSYSVKVYVAGLPAGSTMGMSVKAGEVQNAVVALTASIDMQKQSDIYAEVVYDADEAPQNNSSERQTILVKLPGYPEPTGLEAASSDAGVVLNWNTPAAPRTEDGYVTESFEDYTDFQRTNFGEWTLYDGDKALTYGIGGWHFPKNSDIQSWMIWTPSEVENASTGKKGLTDKLWYPRTGNKMVASFGAFEQNSDDWLISPELSGNAQIISFYAHSLPKATNVDQFQLYFSTTGCETTNFMPLDAAPRTCPDFKNQTFDLSKWDDCLFEYALPQGAKYFAIRKVTYDGWAMFVDDITFAPDTLAAQNGLMLFGYNVYKNGERANATLLPSPTFSDATAKTGDVFKVTAVYNQGESVYSNEVTVGGTEGIVTVSDTGTRAQQPAYDLMGRKLTPATLPRRGIYIENNRKVFK